MMGDMLGWLTRLGSEGGLPLVYYALMGLSVGLYTLWDGYDLGVGMLMAGEAKQERRTQMIATIGPFWDANETWLVLGVGILLVAFPGALVSVMGGLYHPIAWMLAALMVRGVCLELRLKGGWWSTQGWDRVLAGSSAVAGAAQGWMCGRWVTGFQEGGVAWGFSAAVALAVPLFYMWLGSCWLVIKSEGEVERKARLWNRWTWWGAVGTIAAVSVMTPWASPYIANKWWTPEKLVALSWIPLVTAAGLIMAYRAAQALRSPENGEDPACEWRKKRNRTLALSCFVVHVLCLAGLGYSMFPYIVVNKMTLWEAASDHSTLSLIAWGLGITLPMIMAYTIWVHRVFAGVIQGLDYGGVSVIHPKGVDQATEQEYERAGKKRNRNQEDRNEHKESI